MKIMAVDYGAARTGLAVCDRTEFLASPVGTIQEREYKRAVAHVANAVHFAGSKIYLVYENGSTGTVYCYGLDGNYYGKYSGGAYGTANFIRQTQYK